MLKEVGGERESTRGTEQHLSEAHAGEGGENHENKTQRGSTVVQIESPRGWLPGFECQPQVFLAVCCRTSD